MNKLLLVVAIVASVSVGAFAQEPINGYLEDVLCGKAGYPEGYKGKIDLTVTPEKNVVACLTMPNCVASGFGMYIQQANGKYIFHAFDKASSDFVKKQIVDKLNNKADPAPYIEVNGKMTASGLISGVTKAVVTKQPTTAAPTGEKSMGKSDHNM